MISDSDAQAYKLFHKLFRLVFTFDEYPDIGQTSITMRFMACFVFISTIVWSTDTYELLFVLCLLVL